MNSGEMNKRKLIVCVGLQRSGNHAILGWVETLFPGTVFHNNQFQDLFADEAAWRDLLQQAPAPCTIFSFEDSANRTKTPGKLLLDSLHPLPDAAKADYDVHRLVILRDPYNTWASRLAANARAEAFGRPLTSNSSWQLYRDNWLQLAACTDDPSYQVVLFNRWKDDADYRRQICDALGGTYSEIGLDQVSGHGGGSSFDGVPRPSYRDMLRKLPKYTSAKFLKRLASKPGYYLKRFTSPPTVGRTMQVDKRWETLLDSSSGAAIFADQELRQVTGHIFGTDTLPPQTSVSVD